MTLSNTKTVYFVAGATRGIGFALIKKLAASENNFVVGSYRSDSSAGELFKLAEQDNVKTVKLDISSEESIDNLPAQFDAISELDGGIDVAILNAGYGDLGVPVLDITKTSFLDHYVTNTLGPVLTFQKIYKYLLKKETRKVFFVSSSAGSNEFASPFPVTAYGQSKAALNFIVNKLAGEIAAEKFIAISVHPGAVSTDAYKKILSYASEEMVEYMKSIVITPEQSADFIIAALGKVTPELSGKFIATEDFSVMPF